jgi:flagellar biosynthesis protein FlhF
MSSSHVKRFTARTSRDALKLVRQTFGDDAIVLSTRPAADGGVEVLAMPADGVSQLELAAAAAPVVRAADPAPAMHVAESAPVSRAELPRRRAAAASSPDTALPRKAATMPSAAPNADVTRDVEQLAMSTLSFQDYVRERMLKRRQAQRDLAALGDAAPASVSATPPSFDLGDATLRPEAAAPAAAPVGRRVEAPALADVVEHAAPSYAQPDLARREQAAMMAELRAMKGLIEDRFGALAFMEKLQTSPRRATLTQRLLDAGFSPVLIRRLAEGLPRKAASAEDDLAWASGVLEQNLQAAEHEAALEDIGGVYALIGTTGVGKTTSTAKIAAAFATKHGSGNLGLITLDAYRVGAQEQLRTYGRILGVPVHTAHDRASLEDLLELLAGKKMVLIDTAGVGQRDARTRELLEMLSHRSINKLLVVNTSAQGETIEDVLISYHGAACRGVVLSKIDEAVKLAPALDAVIRHKMRVVGVANGQRVPEDWHRLSAQALVQRALRATANRSWRFEPQEVNLVFAGHGQSRPRQAAGPAHA